MTEWSITSSTGTSGLILAGFPPSSMIASRMEARSTTPGTPVRSCMSTRSGEKAISRAVSAVPPAPPWEAHDAIPAMSDALTANPSSWRSRFSRRTFSAKGSRATS